MIGTLNREGSLLLRMYVQVVSGLFVTFLLMKTVLVALYLKCSSSWWSPRRLEHLIGRVSNHTMLALFFVAEIGVFCSIAFFCLFGTTLWLTCCDSFFDTG